MDIAVTTQVIQNYPKVADILPFNDEVNGVDLNSISNICNYCNRRCTTTVLLFSDCFHVFCRTCLSSKVLAAIHDRVEHPFTCFANGCASKVRVELLSVFVPLLTVEYYVRCQLNCFDAVKIIKCPKCDKASVCNDEVKYGTVTCGCCKCIFCIKCLKEPHFPLSCAESVYWKIKASEQSK